MQSGSARPGPRRILDPKHKRQQVVRDRQRRVGQHDHAGGGQHQRGEPVHSGNGCRIYIVTARFSCCVGPPTSRPSDNWVRLLSLEFVSMSSEGDQPSPGATGSRCASVPTAWTSTAHGTRTSGRRCSRPSLLLVGATTRCSCGTTGSSSAMWEADDLQVSPAAMARTEVNAEMAAFFVGLEGWAPNEGIVLLEQIFNLEDQTAEPDDDGLTRTARRLPRRLNDRSG
jgi:hypothetical protein